MAFTSKKEYDRLILQLLKVSDSDILSLCQVNTQFQSICGEEEFWKHRMEIHKPAMADLKNLYGLYQNFTWKQFYFFSKKQKSTSWDLEDWYKNQPHNIQNAFKEGLRMNEENSLILSIKLKEFDGKKLYQIFQNYSSFFENVKDGDLIFFDANRDFGFFFDSLGKQLVPIYVQSNMHVLPSEALKYYLAYGESFFQTQRHFNYSFYPGLVSYGIKLPLGSSYNKNNKWIAINNPSKYATAPIVYFKTSSFEHQIEVNKRIYSVRLI